MRSDFAIFILSHGRANNVITWKTLEKCGNTNRVYIICDNEDTSLEKYQANFGKDCVIVFDKLKKAKEFDTMDTLEGRDRRAIVYARNACFDIAKNLGVKYFLELDDDYTEFRSRVLNGKKLSTIYVDKFDLLVDDMIDFLESSGAASVAFSQTGDFIGGTGSRVFKERCCRKAMNSFFCTVDRPFTFIGRINEDVNTYTSLGSRGKLFFTVADVSLDQLETQKNRGGMSDLYALSGTYIKSFFTVICAPSAVKVAAMGDTHKRIHHLIDWDKAVPKIISDRFRN